MTLSYCRAGNMRRCLLVRTLKNSRQRRLMYALLNALERILEQASSFPGKMSNGIWKLVVEPAVHKALQEFPRKDQRAIAAAVDAMGLDPYSGDIEKMKGQENTWRRRVGSYRIKYDVYPNLRFVMIFKVERRTSTTY